MLVSLCCSTSRVGPASSEVVGVATGKIFTAHSDAFLFKSQPGMTVCNLKFVQVLWARDEWVLGAVYAGGTTHSHKFV